MFLFNFLILGVLLVNRPETFAFAFTSMHQSILNAAAHLIGDIPKFAHISVFIRDSLHWLLTRQRILFKTLSIMRNCLVGVAPTYLRSFCTRVSSLPARAYLRSSSRGRFDIPLRGRP